ncbi:MAG: hypothetical protein DDT19_01187 [Syntrophomonadaceae bacterium]|nr:hypothetical protein [Bacillota bacterium]
MITLCNCYRCGSVFEAQRKDARYCRPCKPIRKKLMDAKYKVANRKKIVEQMRVRRKDLYYMEKQMRWNNKWRKNNREKALAIKSKSQRKRYISIIGDYSVNEWLSLKEKYMDTCPACLRKEPEIKLSVDHILPIYKGGTNNIENIQPLCRSCNSKKQTKLIFYPCWRMLAS